MFCLVVDDFGVKYQRDADVHDLLEVLRLEDVVKDDWSGCSYVGFRIKHNRGEGTMNLSMLKYISDAAERFGVDTTKKKIDNPFGASTTGEAAPPPHSSRNDCSRSSASSYTMQGRLIPLLSRGSANCPPSRRIQA
jgi:hypothetical protein